MHAPEDTALSPDGRTVAVQAGHVVRVLDVSTGGQRYDPLKVEYGIGGVAWSPDGRWLATVGMAGGDLWTRGPGATSSTSAPRPRSTASRGARIRALSRPEGPIRRPRSSIWKIDDDGRVTERTVLLSDETADGIDGLAFSPGKRPCHRWRDWR